jgi:hypothetical protein
MACPGRADDARSSPAHATAPDQELDEVLVRGKRSKPRPGFKEYQQPLDWLARLVGRFVVDGHVDLHATGNPDDILEVSGRVECVGFGMAPGVECEVKIRWPEKPGPDGADVPGRVSTLNPAVMLFGFDPARQGVQQITVDNNGTAESALGLHVTADVVQSRTPCAARPGDCERVVRITALPDLKVVEMLIDLEIDKVKATRFMFTLHRVPGVPSVVFGRKK